MPRVSERYRYEATNNRLNTVRNIADGVHEDAVSGRKLHKMSDDPVAATRVFRNRTRLENLTAFQKTIDFGRGYLSKTEDALMSINESVNRAKELCIQQANSTYDADTRKIVAAEVKQLADQVVQLGNSTYNDRYVFGGFQSSQPPISPDGSYAGDDGAIFVQVDEDSYRPINISGREMFEVAPDREGIDLPVVQTFRDVYHALMDNDLPGLHKGMERLEAVAGRVRAATATLGARRQGLEDVSQRLERAEEDLYRDNNALESTDPVKAALDLKRSETALQTTLASTSKVLTPSLMDFLK